MLFMYVLASSYTLVARMLHEEWFPNRRIYHRKTLENLKEKIAYERQGTTFIWVYFNTLP